MFFVPAALKARMVLSFPARCFLENSGRTTGARPRRHQLSHGLEHLPSRNACII